MTFVQRQIQVSFTLANGNFQGSAISGSGRSDAKVLVMIGELAELNGIEDGRAIRLKEWLQAPRA